ncbi:MAG TPA: UDP-N-acetylmuramate--L-alanine ligase [Solirubrobacteraceae bacterium]|nr:UDP-N-acetylmuramate--L-alanine ligase [Solirubrobacteraceae bacterium]
MSAAGNSKQPWAGRRIHLVGAAGAGMSAYALAARALGASVTGSDRESSPYARSLAERTGIEVAIGHDPANVPPGGDVELFYSSAVPPENPEREAARERGLRELSRAALLRELSTLKRTVAVAGAHGKTTTASMLAHILLQSGTEPSFLIGGVLEPLGTNARWGDGEWLVVEADESDRSMLELDVEIAVVTNVELDHHATFGSLAELEETFRAFLAGARQAVLWNSPSVLALRDGPLVGYEAEDVEAAGSGTRFTWRGRAVSLAVPGLHNARNATAALEAAALTGIEVQDAVRALEGFSGVGRRFERLGTSRAGAVIYSDYAHHPTEVRATLEAARALATGRLVVAFQPHLYSRTAALAQEFAAALAAADLIVVLEVYPAREDPRDWPGVGGELIAGALARLGHRDVHFEPTLQDAAALLERELRDGDLCIVMGAGDIDALGRRLVAA